ncbi:TlpA family protein disulfide reductase [Flavisolibacter tropicus]|nr:TlpA disulfide reductase family protein [Flavisolibacter tropicus]
MRPSFYLLLFLCTITVTLHAQNENTPFLNIGDPAPPLRVRKWFKGLPVQQFEKGKIYVVEFWATWCRPCLASMPHLSTLAREYKDHVTFIAIDVMENKTTTLENIKAVVERMGSRMDFPVATEDSNLMATGWIEASAHEGIPATFVVNAEGKLAWFGHPKDLPAVLPNIVNNTWNIKEASSRLNENRRLRDLDREVPSLLMEYKVDQFKPGSVTKPDSILFAINEMVRKEPKLKYAPFIAYDNFRFLLMTDPDKAYAYGKEVLVNPTYQEPAYNAIIGNIAWYSDKMKIPGKIYELGAEACQLEIDHVVYPELVNLPEMYSKMADMYWRSNNKIKAIEAQQKAIDAMKVKQALEMTELETKFQQYKDMKTF